MNKKLPTSELIETVRLVAENGLQKTATIQGVTSNAIGSRVRELEARLGLTIYTRYDYNRMTWQGREFLKDVDQTLYFVLRLNYED